MNSSETILCSRRVRPPIDHCAEALLISTAVALKKTDTKIQAELTIYFGGIVSVSAALSLICREEVDIVIA